MTATYAFVAWISTIVSYFVFLIWVFAPESFLHKYGITYYPSRYYALAIPSYGLVAFILLIIGYIGINMYHTFDADDLRTFQDSQSIRGSNEFRKNLSKHEYLVPDFCDMEPWAVSGILFNNNLNKRSTQKKQPHQWLKLSMLFIIIPKFIIKILNDNDQMKPFQLCSLLVMFIITNLLGFRNCYDFYVLLWILQLHFCVKSQLPKLSRWKSAWFLTLLCHSFDPTELIADHQSLSGC